MEKPVNYMAQTGSLEDLIWSIMNDAETESHIDRFVQSLERDFKDCQDDQEQDEILDEINELEEFKQKVRGTRYDKTFIAVSLALDVSEKKQDDRYSCIFKHQLLSMAEMRDAKDAIDVSSLKESIDTVYTSTVNNCSFAISKFLGLEVESCMACLFEKNKIMRREKNVI